MPNQRHPDKTRIGLWIYKEDKERIISIMERESIKTLTDYFLSRIEGDVKNQSKGDIKDAKC